FPEPNPMSPITHIMLTPTAGFPWIRAQSSDSEPVGVAKSQLADPSPFRCSARLTCGPGSVQLHSGIDVEAAQDGALAVTSHQRASRAVRPRCEMLRAADYAPARLAGTSPFVRPSGLEFWPLRLIAVRT